MGHGQCLFFFYFDFLRQGFSVALEPVLELVLVHQAGLELTEIRLPSAGIKGMYHHHLAMGSVFNL